MELPSDISPHDGRFVDGQHFFACRVYFEDTDFSGIVYHANYLRYFERARSDLLRVLDIDHRSAMEEDDGAFAVAEMNIKYVRPAELNDNLLVVTQVTSVRAAGSHMAQKIYRDGERLATVELLVVYITFSGRAKRMPKHWLTAFESVNIHNADT